MKKELFLFVFLSVFITLIDLGAQTRYTVVNFGLNQPVSLYLTTHLIGSSNYDNSPQQAILLILINHHFQISNILFKREVIT